MGRRIDVEFFIDKIINILQTNLSTKISEINSEFTGDGLSITLEAPATSSYFFGGLDDEVLADPWVVVDVLGIIPSVSNGRSVKKEITAIVVFGGSKFILETREKIKRAFFRYSRAIEEVIAENFFNMGEYSILKIEQIPSIELESDAGEVIRTDPGISIKVNII